MLWLEANVGTYKDTAGTLPAKADNDLVALWKDQSGQGNDATQATTLDRPALKLGLVNTLPVVRFAASGTTSIVTGSVTMGIGTGDFWGAIIWQIPHYGGTNLFNTAYSIGAFNPGFYLPGHSGAAPWGNQFYLSTSHSFTANINESTFYLTEIVRVSGTIKQYQSSGGVSPTVDANTFAVANSIPDAAISIGYDTSGADYFTGDIAELLFYSNSLSGANQAALETYLIQKYWQGNPARQLVLSPENLKPLIDD